MNDDRIDGEHRFRDVHRQRLQVDGRRQIGSLVPAIGKKQQAGQKYRRGKTRDALVATRVARRSSLLATGTIAPSPGRFDLSF